MGDNTLDNLYSTGGGGGLTEKIMKKKGCVIFDKECMCGLELILIKYTG